MGRAQHGPTVQTTWLFTQSQVSLKLYNLSSTCSQDSQKPCKEPRVNGALDRVTWVGVGAYIKALSSTERWLSGLLLLATRPAGSESAPWSPHGGRRKPATPASMTATDATLSHVP